MSDVLLNGAPPDGDTLALSRGLHYGDGVFRTVLVHGSQPMDLDLHLDKLRADAARLGIEAPPRELLAQEARSLAARREVGVLKLILTRRAGVRGYRCDESEADRLLLLGDSPSYPASHWESGIRVFRCPLALAEQPALAGVKHLNRLEQVLASRDWPAGLDEGIVCDAIGSPVGGTRSNLFWVGGGVLYTPALERSGVEGIMRNKIMQLALDLQVVTVAVRASWAALDRAEEAFVTNALIGAWPVRELCGRTLSAPGPLTARLVDALRHPRLA